MKTLVGTPDPEPEPEKPEIVYCVTDLGPGFGSFIVPAQLSWGIQSNFFTATNVATATTNFTVTFR